MTRVLVFAACLALCTPAFAASRRPLERSVPAGPVPMDQSFTAPDGGEGVAVIHASCEQCDWGMDGREAAAVRILVDGRYSQHLLLARGADDADYHV